ncbi:SDR family oxidoreductase [Pendulispora brunnea]|uniref:SDR family oxidoreductase n=1 Tax=Pendulispora brunnea TaxID=2905690 RepID=A0ABZ2K134_9BACT
MVGKVALVTGGSRGIGAAIVRALGARGFKVAINCLKSTDLAAKILRESGIQGAVFKADATNHAEVADMVRAIERELGPVDAAVHNANVGLVGSAFAGPFHLTPWEDVKHKLLEEMAAFHALCAATVPGMVDRKWGRIVGVSTIVSRFASVGTGLHAAGKAAMDASCRTLSKELGPHGITVNIAAPGFIETDVTAHESEALRQKVAKITPLRRLGTPDDIGGVVAFLCSDEARWITGQYIPLNGGGSTV